MICGRCRKPLTDPVSKRRGYGPKCWKAIVGVDETVSSTDRIRRLKSIKNTRDIFVKPNGSGLVTNVPIRIALYSEEGSGLRGSGAADLALNILSAYFGGAVALELHRHFKEDFITKLPSEGGAIRSSEVFAWRDDRTLFGGNFEQR